MNTHLMTLAESSQLPFISKTSMLDDLAFTLETLTIEFLNDQSFLQSGQDDIIDVYVDDFNQLLERHKGGMVSADDLRPVMAPFLTTMPVVSHRPKVQSE